MLAPVVAAQLSPATARVAAAVVAGVVGLVIGSFLNVVVYRVPRGLSVVRPGSFCPTCSAPVRSADNVPVLSWLALRGRCRSCHSPISARYPLVEGLTGALFALVGAVAGPHLAVPALCASAATFVALVAIDLDHQPSPQAVSLVGGGIALALFVVPAARAGHWAPLAASGAGALAALAVLGAAWGGTRSADPGARRRRRGATATLVPLGVLLGWVGAGSPAAVAAGVGCAAVAGVILGVTRPAENAAGPWRYVVGLPLAGALGAAVGFAVAAALGALGGT